MVHSPSFLRRSRERVPYAFSGYPGFAATTFGVTMNPENPSVITSTAPQGLLTRAQVADLFGVCKETIRRWETQGLFQPVTINARVLRYRVADVQAVIGNN